MAKITIGSAHDQARLQLRVQLFETSPLELNVGSAHDMAVQQIDILEMQRARIEAAVEDLSGAARSLGTTAPAIQAEADKIAKTAQQIVADHKWYDISLKGLFDAAKTVGETAQPLLASAVKVVELLAAIYGVAAK